MYTKKKHYQKFLHFFLLFFLIRKVKKWTCDKKPEKSYSAFLDCYDFANSSMVKLLNALCLLCLLYHVSTHSNISISAICWHSNVSEGRDEFALGVALGEVEERGANIQHAKAVAMDLSPAYTTAVQNLLRDIQIATPNQFHLFGLLYLIF